MAPGAAGKVINVGVGEKRTLNQTIAFLNKIFRRDVKPGYAPPREGDVLHSQADISLARDVLGYEPKIRFEQGLQQTVEWYRKAVGEGRGEASNSDW
jgi:nucleoside-diphosphate-sugar epimerase